MPWKECHVVDERLRFIARLLDWEKMARLAVGGHIAAPIGCRPSSSGHPAAQAGVPLCRPRGD